VCVGTEGLQEVLENRGLFFLVGNGLDSDSLDRRRPRRVARRPDRRESGHEADDGE